LRARYVLVANLKSVFCKVASRCCSIHIAGVKIAGKIIVR
jgi:hypothetical protein